MTAPRRSIDAAVAPELPAPDTSTQNQALCAILFLYNKVYLRDIPGLDGLQRARRPRTSLSSSRATRPAVSSSGSILPIS